MRAAALARKDYWKDPKVLEKHRERRKERYKDPSVALAEKQRQRALYRERTGVSVVNHARASLDQTLDAHAFYSVEDLSLMLGRARGYVAHVIGKGMWPAPARDDPHAPYTYTPAQVHRLLGVFADHIDTVASTYRADHTETRHRLFAAMTEETP